MTAHIPVFLHEALDSLIVDLDGLYVDGTFGRGGHSAELLQRLSGNAHVIGLDKDPEAIDFGRSKFKNEKRLELLHESFSNLTNILQVRGKLGNVSGVLLDLGVSSPQLDQAQRGFSFMNNGPLDMRMNNSAGPTAAEWIAASDQNELTETFRNLGEEKHANRIAKSIINSRAQQPITTTQQLAAIVSKAHPNWQKGKHPATKVFQAIRIRVNNELNDLEHLLANVLKALKIGGRLVIISFHSLEDRRVKKFIRDQENGPFVPKSIPIKHSQVQISMKRVGKALTSSNVDIIENRRARSAVMRVAERVA